MTSQLPSDAVGLAIGVLVYSVFSLSLGLLTAWLVWAHHEGTSCALASIAQQIHTIVRWRDIKLEQHRHTTENIGNPELALAGNSVGLDLALFYIQFTCYGIEALLIFFWSAVLLQSIFQLRALVNTLRYSNLMAKLCAVLFPILMICLLQVKALQNNAVAFFVIANTSMTVGLVGGATMLLSILGRYIYTRHALLSFKFRYGKSSGKDGARSHSRVSATVGSQRRQRIYDRWLILRLGVGFVALGIFQLVTIVTEVTAQGRNNRDNLSKTADLSGRQAKSDFVFFVPGATPPLVTFLVFGTTRPFREYMWNAFVPKCLNSRGDRRTPKSSDDTGPGQGSRSQEVHYYGPRSELGHNGVDSVRLGTMASCSSNGRREDDNVPILEESSRHVVGGGFYGDEKRINVSTTHQILR
ncbi:hypothetical protein B0T10DRAFT_455549 [Thelonectria olida]|uniref:Uncharacterized protein n=1 Tax=Thelonectria olida TaxID=1576542 RepID=A0A9P9AW20_9HYPO|nr:hypothetical protein B0T10DRAFT_455549 [Thelonectria olida]